MVLYGQFVLLFEITPSVDNTSGTLWAVCVVVVRDKTLCGQY